MTQLIPRALALALVFCSLTNYAQDTIVSSYHFSYNQNFYYEIDEGIDSNLPADWLDEDHDLAVIFPFDFEVFDKEIIGLTSYYTPSLLFFILKEDIVSDELPFLIPFGTPTLQNRVNAELNEELSDISTHITGEVGNRIVKIQYRNVGFQQDILEDQYSSDFINFQLWFYEASHAIEIHYGTFDIPNATVSFEGASGPSFGIFEIEEEIFLNGGDPTTAFFIEENPNAPNLMQETEDIEDYMLNTMPPIGMTYTLTPFTDTIMEILPPTAIETVWLNGLEVFPNPSSDFLNIEVKKSKLLGADYLLTNGKGKVLFSGKLEDESIQVNLQNLPSGIYYLKLQKGNDGVIKKIVRG